MRTVRVALLASCLLVLPNASHAIQLTGGGTTNYIARWTGPFSLGNSTIFELNSNVGIGTANPDPNFKLSVNGKIRAKELKVETAWSDYVFADDYHLMPLSTLEQHIITHRHLPGIPTAAEVEADGIAVGEMNAKLLAKIEELTLYVIELEKKTKSLEDKLAKDRR